MTHDNARTQCIIDLGHDSWIADGEGDPPRTMRKEFAKRYPSRESALRALAYYIERNTHRDSTAWKVVIL